MLILALDTTTRAGSVAVVRDGSSLSVVAGDEHRTHGERLPGEIAAALADAAVTRYDLDLLVVAIGPGAFTGLRIGLATMQGLAMVLSRPVVGVSALDALAIATAINGLSLDPAQAVVTWIDAQRGEVFGALYPCSSISTTSAAAAAEAIVGRPADILRDLPQSVTQEAVFVGDGALRYQSLIESQGGRVRASPALAPLLATLGRATAMRGVSGPPHALQPLYVRRPDAELERARRSAP